MSNDTTTATTLLNRAASCDNPHECEALIDAACVLIDFEKAEPSDAFIDAMDRLFALSDSDTWELRSQEPYTPYDDGGWA